MFWLILVIYFAKFCPKSINISIFPCIFVRFPIMALKSKFSFLCVYYTCCNQLKLKSFIMSNICMEFAFGAQFLQNFIFIKGSTYFALRTTVVVLLASIQYYTMMTYFQIFLSLMLAKWNIGWVGQCASTFFAQSQTFKV